MSDALENPLKAVRGVDGQVVPAFARFMQGARQGLQTRTPKTSHEVYTRAMEGLSEEADRLAEISDAAAYSPDLDKRASIGVRRAGVLGKMVEVEKTKVELLKSNLDVDTVIFAVFSAVSDVLTEAFDDIEAEPSERQRWKIQVLNALKDKVGGLRDKVDAKILEVRDALPKMELKTAGER
jgi:hypothetical protein